MGSKIVNLPLELSENGKFGHGEKPRREVVCLDCDTDAWVLENEPVEEGKRRILYCHECDEEDVWIESY